MATFYGGIDLHSRTSQICVIDAEGQKVKEGRLPNHLPEMLGFLAPFGQDLQIAVESTLNWYWLVDGLQDHGYDVKLAHTFGLYMITGAKVKTDRRDAYKLARYLRLGELPEAYIYPRDKRPVRDLLRRRNGLVQQRSTCYTGLRIQLKRHNLDTFGGGHLKQLSPKDLEALPLPEETAVYCGMVLDRIHQLSAQCATLERMVRRQAKQDPAVKRLQDLPGVHDILSWTIYYEVGDIGRFKADKNFISYARLAPPLSQSDSHSSRGHGGKQGNPYLKWAFVQAAIAAARYYPACRKFKNRHAGRRRGNLGRLIANNILAHKLATAAFYILRDGVCYEPMKLF